MRRGEVAGVDLDVPGRKKNLTTEVGVVPTQRLKAGGEGGGEEFGEETLVLLRENKTWAERMFDGERLGIQDMDAAGFGCTEEDAADFASAAGATAFDFLAKDGRAGQSSTRSGTDIEIFANSYG